jgi:serine/threonine-protein kinase ATR
LCMADRRCSHFRGCVSGAQLQGVRDLAERDGKFDFDMIDGYDELGWVYRSSLSAAAADWATRREHPEVQAKIRRVVEQGHIDPEDFNGVRPLFTLKQTKIRSSAN